MSLRLVRQVLCPVVVLAAGLAGMAPAGAATASGWQISDLLTSQGTFFQRLATNRQSEPANSIVHYTGGQFVSQPPPTEPGFTSQVGGLTLIPGTTSLWGLGALTSSDGSTTETDIVSGP